MAVDGASPKSGEEIAGQLARWWQETEAAIRRGQSARARRFLRWILAVCPEEEEAWLWLARLATDPGERVDSLRQVYALHPDSRRVVAALREARALQLKSAVGELPRRTVLLRCLPDQRCSGPQKAPARTEGNGRRHS